VAYVRTVKTASRAVAAQVVWSSRRGSRNIERIGSARDDAEMDALKAAARQRLAATTVDAVSMFDSHAGIFALCSAILAALIGRNPAEARSRAEHLEALNLNFDTWLDER
jgi:hypothetical protein